MSQVQAAEQQQFLNERELAALIGKSARTVQGWRVRGEGPRFCKLGRGRRSAVVYSRRDVDAFIAANTFASTTEAQQAERAASKLPKAKAARGRA